MSQHFVINICCLNAKFEKRSFKEKFMSKVELAFKSWNTLMADNQITIPPELEKLLCEFTINATAENPEDLVSHAADYFTKLRDKNRQEALAELKNTTHDDEELKGIKFGTDDTSEEGSKENISKVLGHKTTKRGTAEGESYTTEEDDDDDYDVMEIIPKTDEQRRRIREQSGEVFLFRFLDDADLGSVIDAMMPKPVKKGDVVIRQGDDGDFFYLIDEGNFDISFDQAGEEKKIATYEGKGFFGELALLHNQPRAATVKAVSDGFLWAVDRRTFNKFIVKRAFVKGHQYMQLLEGVSELKPLTEYEKMQVADALHARSYSAGEVIVHEGDEGDGMYFIVEGKVSVKQKKTDGKETTDKESTDEEISQLGPGEFFGELALVKHQPRAATVIALENTEAAFLDVKSFERLLGPCMNIMERRIES